MKEEKIQKMQKNRSFETIGHLGLVAHDTQTKNRNICI